MICSVFWVIQIWSQRDNDNLEAVARFVSLQYVNLYSEMTYKGVHLPLRVEGTRPFLQAVHSHINRSSITPESIQTCFIQKRSGLFSTHVKG
jgi:hypothetical protein